jgi:hypothetical protein
MYCTLGWIEILDITINLYFNQKSLQFSRFFIDFLNELRLFIEEKPICTKKKFRHSAVCPEKFGSPLLPFPFNLETFPFGLVNDLVPNRSYLFLDFENKFRREATIRIFGSFFTFTQKFLIFLGLKHNKIKFQT